MDMETRDFELRLDNVEERTISGIAVPYGQDANIGGVYTERFVPGAIDSVENVKIFYGHDSKMLPVGRVIEGRDTEQGFEITAKISDTSLGNDVMTLMRDGVLNKFSVGFQPVEQVREGSTITRTKVELKEVSIVNWAAYDSAAITEVRGESLEDIQTPITETESELETNIELDVRAVQDEVAELRRVVESTVIAEPSAPAISFRSAGEYAKALIAKDPEAVELFRTATTTADSVVLPGWLGQINDLIANNRPTWNAFSSAALPASGMTVEYAHVSSNTLAVGKQAAELDALSFGNIAIDTVSTNVETFGGYTSYSRQVVDRSTVNFVDTAIRALAIQYAKATNAAIVAKLAGLTWTGKVMDADGGSAASLLEGIASGASYIQANSGLNPEFIIAAPDAYITMMKVAGGDGRPVVNVSGAGVNNIGAANVPALTGNLFGLPVIVDAQLATGVVYLANSAALQTLESAGAPARLNDGDITTLTDSISVYGYAAITVPFEGAIVKLDVTA